ncbi:MAG: hypothetical protein HOP28_05970 [Gemmatimonadales bacterium]|nr:hypothetical protein [Gemmatimonadales bacterium]
MPFPFEVPFEAVLADLDGFTEQVFSALASDFLIMPKGAGFVEFPTFEEGYELLKRGTHGFEVWEPNAVLAVVEAAPIALIVLRAILGFTPPEWAYEGGIRTGVELSQGYVRTLDRRVRIEPTRPLNLKPISRDRLRALVVAACSLLVGGAPAVPPGKLHRLDKVDTKLGVESLKTMATLGVAYSMLLYERYLGRPFAGHRDSVSELVGGGLETAIEKALLDAGVSNRKTARADKITGFDQAPDFVVPSEANPRVVIEAKIAEDDGTARDKVTRVQHLASLSIEGRSPNDPRFEVIACIGGRGFRVRREDMKKLLLATRGKVFTIQSLDQLVDNTSISGYRTRTLARRPIAVEKLE